MGFAGIALCVTGSTVRQQTFRLGRESPILIVFLWPLVCRHGTLCGRGLMCHPEQQSRFQSEILSSHFSVNNTVGSQRPSGRDVVP